MKKLIFTGVLLSLLSGCSYLANQMEPDYQISVDWVDVVVWNHKKYLLDSNKTKMAGELVVDEELGTVEFSVVGSEEYDNPAYQLKNREATYSSKGSRIFSIKGYNSAQYIMVQEKVYKAEK